MIDNVAQQSVFGTYSQKENQVTSALLKILEADRGGDLLNDFLQSLGDNGLPEKSLSLEAQKYIDDKDVHSIPDGLISCNYAFKIYIESKLSEDINRDQLENHKKLIAGDRDGNNKLIYITKHATRPAELSEGILWTNWSELLRFLKAYEPEESNVILDYLIEQFELLITSLGLYDDSEKRVVIVGGRWGEPVALEYGFYACQANRYFKKSKYLAFYYDQRIKYLFEVIGEKKDCVDIRELKGEVPEEYFRKREPNYQPENRTFFKLKKVHEFMPVIENDTVSRTGRRVAFTQGQTYTTYDRIMKAKKTSELREYSIK